MSTGALARSKLPELVAAVYDSVTDASRWQDTLQSICDAADARLATLAVVDTVTNLPRFSMACGDDALLAPLISDYALDVPFYRALPKMEIDVAFTVDLLYDLQGRGARQSWLDSRIAREWVIPNGLDDFFWLVLMRQPTRVGTLVIMTDKDRSPITRDDCDAVSLLSPHIRRAIAIGDLFEKERREAEMFRGIIEALAHPVLIVADDMQVLFANAAAEALLAEKTVVSCRRGALSFSYAPADAAIGRAVQVGLGDEFALGPAGINVPIVKACAPAVAHVMPLARRDLSARIARSAAAAVFIAEAGCGPMPALDAIAALFGLTVAEKRVAGQVAAGRSRKEIALAAGVSDGTVKTQLAAVFDKTGAGDQRELQLLMRELSPPVRLS